MSVIIIFAFKSWVTMFYRLKPKLYFLYLRGHEGLNGAQTILNMGEHVYAVTQGGINRTKFIHPFNLFRVSAGLKMWT